MKKVLSGVLAASLALSCFASIAFGAELTAQEKFDALKEKGIFAGYVDGSAGLDKTMTRAEVSKVLVKLLGLTEDASAASYSDLDGATWAVGFIGAASKAGIMNGVGGGKFDPSGTFTTEQLAAVLARALDLPASSDAVTGNVDEWAKGYVAAAIKAGLLTKADDYTAPALRDLLVAATYAADAALNPVKAAAVTEVKATGVKKVTVSFNAAVDTTKAVLKLKSGATIISTTATWNDAKTEATLEASAALATGDYTVAVSGIELAEGKDTGTVTVAPQRVELINIEKQAYQNGTAGEFEVVYKVLNQYGEDITDGTDTANLQFTTSVGSLKTAAKGKYTVQGASDKTAAVVTFVDKVFGKAARQEVSVVAAKAVAEITVNAPELKSGKTAIEANVTGYTATYTAKDQYGNDYKLAAGDIAKLTFISTDSVVSNFSVNTTDNKLVFDIAAFNGPKSVTLTTIVNANGSSSKVTFDVKGTAKAAEPTLVAPSSRFGLNDTNFKVELQVKDQYGNAMSADDIVAAASEITVTAGNSAKFTVNGTKIVKDGDKAYVSLTHGTETGSAVLTVTVNGTGKSSSQTITVVDAKYAASVVLSPSESSAVYLAGNEGTITVKATFKDQYGDDYTPDAATQNVVIEGSDYAAFTNVTAARTIDARTLKDTGIAIKPNAADKSLKLTANLYKTTDVTATGTLVATNEKTVTSVKADAALTYSVASLGTIYGATTNVVGGANVATFSKDVTLEAKDSAGNKVAITQSMIQSVGAADATKLNVVGVNVVAKVAEDLDTFLNVTYIDTQNNVKLITVPVKVSKTAPAVASITAKQTDTAVTGITIDDDAAEATVASFVASNAGLWFEVKDQYGTTSLAGNLTVYVKDADGTAVKTTYAFDHTKAVDGKVIVTAVLGDKTVTVEVKVND